LRLAAFSSSVVQCLSHPGARPAFRRELEGEGEWARGSGGTRVPLARRIAQPPPAAARGPRSDRRYRNRSDSSRPSPEIEPWHVQSNQLEQSNFEASELETTEAGPRGGISKEFKKFQFQPNPESNFGGVNRAGLARGPDSSGRSRCAPVGACSMACGNDARCRLCAIFRPPTGSVSCGYFEVL
jgi:hypothetical protein